MTAHVAASVSASSLLRTTRVAAQVTVPVSASRVAIRMTARVAAQVAT